MSEKTELPEKKEALNLGPVSTIKTLIQLAIVKINDGPPGKFFTLLNVRRIGEV